MIQRRKARRPLHSEHSTTTDLRPRHTRYTENLDNERCAREADIPDSIDVRSHVGSTVGSRKLGLRGFGWDEGEEIEQEDKVEILTEESVRMRYMLLGDPTGNSTAWYVDKDVPS